MPTLTLIRGLPGSGKSTMAQLILKLDGPNHKEWFEADHFFTDLLHGYVFDAKKLNTAHSTCQANTRLSLQFGNDAIVSNTFTTLKEMKPYIDMAKELGCALNVLECKGQFGNIHNVPEETLEKMRQRWYEFKPL